MDSISFLPIALDIGSGGILGFIAGYAAKKAVKVIVVLIGLGILALRVLELKGFLTVNWSKMAFSTGDAAQAAAGQAYTFTDMLINTVPLAGSFGVGAMLGFKQG